MEPEWQMMSGNNEWVFGVKIRGIVRKPLAEVYFNEDIKQDGDPEYGWVWFAWTGRKDGQPERGVACSLPAAVLFCENALGVV